MRKKFLSRIARRKDPAPTEPEEGFQIPPPTDIEPGVPHSTEDTKNKSYGSHLDLELLASGEPPQTDSANGSDAVESGDSPALEPLAASVMDGSRATPEPPREAAPFEEYGLDLELLVETESNESSEMLDPSQKCPESAMDTVESVEEAAAPDPQTPQESEPDVIDEIVQQIEESLAVSESVPVNESVPYKSESTAEVSAHGQEIPEAGDPETGDDTVSVSEQAAMASVADNLPEEDEQPTEDGEVASAIAESGVETAASEPEISWEGEPEKAEDITEEVEKPLPASVLPELPEELPESSLAENVFFPLVRDTRGAWRPGKGFSRSELREAGLSLADAARLHIRVDKRRRNAHPMNVSTLEKARNGA